MHIQRNWASGVLFSLAFTALISACSSGGGDETSTPPLAAATSAEGLWTGTSGNGRTIVGAVLDDGSYWFLHSAVGAPTLVSGAVQGTGSAQRGIFTSSNGIDFDLESGRQIDVAVTANYVTRQSLNGTLLYSLSGTPWFTNTFTGTFSPVYDDTPDFAKVAGTYTGSIVVLPGSRSFTVTVSDSGAFMLLDNDGPGGSGATSGGLITGCPAAGALSPRAQGNVYDITFTHHTERGCHGDPYGGVAVFDATTNTLYILARANGLKVFPFIGTKQ